MTVGTGSRVSRQDNSTPGRLPVVVVTDHVWTSRWLLALFSDPSFDVTLSSSFSHAKSRLIEQTPALIVASVQLGEYNGLGLVLRAKASNPDVRAVVLSRVADPVLQSDAEGLGATFVTLPIEHRELRAAIIRTLFQPAIDAANPIRAPFERRLHHLPASADFPAGAGAVDRHPRESLFPMPLPAMVHFGAPQSDA